MLFRLRKNSFLRFNYNNRFLLSRFTHTNQCRPVDILVTIEYSFNRYLNTTPRTYLKALRLNHFRRDLLKANPAKIKVSDVANHWGFWHMGQMASDYKKMFGELPSDTIKKS